MSWLLSKLRRLGGFALLPISILPFVLAVPVLADQHDTYLRLHKTGPVAAPNVELTPAEKTKFPPLPPTQGEVPVLAYHGINGKRDGYSVSPAAFARQLELLKHAGFETISVGQYARFRRGDLSGLPQRPILITFDDGRLDSYRYADKALAREHMRAAMYVIGAHLERGDLFYLTWKELHAMRRSGRWDVQPHAFDGHRTLAVDSAGDTAPFYAARRFLRSTGRESFADYEQRVSLDIFKARDMMHGQGIPAPTFAVPYGDYGQRAGNDARIPAFMSALLERQFGTYFVQADNNEPEYTRPGTGAAGRFEIHTNTTLGALYGWLKRHHPATERAERRAAQAARAAKAKHVHLARKRAHRQQKGH